MEFIIRLFLDIHRPFSFRNVRFIALLASLLFLVSAPGCKKSEGKVPVKGHVSYRGETIEHASLTFFPDTGRPDGTTIENGTYATELAPGEYTVAVLIGVDLPKGYKEGDKVPPPKIVLPEEYTSRMKSTLKATVKAGQSEPIDFELK